CNPDPLNVDVDKINLELDIERMEHDLFRRDKAFSMSELQNLRMKYGEFFDLYCLRILNLREQSDSLRVMELDLFTSDVDMQGILLKSDSLYGNFDRFAEKFELYFKHHKYHFPEKLTPRIVTMFSAIQYGFIVTDTVLGIALDKYLGKDCIYYPALGFPKFLSDKLTPEHMLIDAMEAWFLSDYPENDIGETMLDKMIHRGKLYYYLDAVAVDAHDTLKIGYSLDQLHWCKQNEYFLWSYFIENELLFSTNFQKYVKFIDDGFTTPGFPEEAPAQLASYVAWQIVRSYMNNNDMSLQDLMNENDANKILKDSKYKPEKNIK
ncbi:MAG: hypothetical protein HKN22_07430, partial [Bacteroidia bacterium]|nr:hypothetical protein [Bacteroidia bacterium]